MSGDPSYFAINVPDPRRAQAFFGELLEWETGPAAAPGALHVRNVAPAGGLHPLHGGEAGITLFFGVADIDAAITQVRALGGTAGDRMDLPTGPIALCADDQGAAFGLHQPPAG